MFPGCLYKVENYLPLIDFILRFDAPSTETVAHLRGDADPRYFLQLFVVPDRTVGDALNQVLLKSPRDVNQEELSVTEEEGEGEDIAVSGGLIGHHNLLEEKAGVCPDISVDYNLPGNVGQLTDDLGQGSLLTGGSFIIIIYHGLSVNRTAVPTK